MPHHFSYLCAHNSGIYIGNGQVVHFRDYSAASKDSASEDEDSHETKVTRSLVTDKERDAPLVAGSPRSRVMTSPVVQFCMLASSTASLSSDDYQVRRFRYGVKKLEADYLSSYGTCTVLTQQSPEQIARIAKFYADHPNDFGEYESCRTDQHFAIFCSTCDVEIDESSTLATPPSLMMPPISAEILKSTGAPSTAANVSKGKVAAAATATCGLLAAGALWGMAPAAVIGGAVYASAKYVSGRQGQQQQMAQKKQD